MEEKVATEVEFYSDYAHVGNDEPNYTAQFFEIEYGVTELFTTAIYLEGGTKLEHGEDCSSSCWVNGNAKEHGLGGDSAPT